jgi:two-component system cell cycle response regulator DivK
LVVDSGPGIAAADQARIFDEFNGSTTPSRARRGGTGLSLSISRRIVELHVTASRSIRGHKGSTFTISIPVNAQPVRTPPNEQEDTRGQDTVIARSCATTRAGYDMVEANDGAEGVAMAAEHKPDLILMDIQMPVMDGYEATRRIKADPALKSIPVIAVTSYALSGDEDKARAAGCDGYIAKPFSPRQMLAKVREVIG